MALIKCPECGGKVSDQASACIHCGCPMNASKLELVNIDEFDHTFYISNDNGQVVKTLPPKSKATILNPDGHYAVTIAGQSETFEIYIPLKPYNKISLYYEPHLFSDGQLFFKKE